MNDVDVTGIILNWILFFALVALVYWIWRTFSKFAGEHNKVKWPYGILGVITFFIGSFVVGGLLEKILTDLVLPGLLKLPAGLLSCWGLYKLLNILWTKNINR